MSGVSMNHWLRKSPQPVAILADERRIEVSRNPRGWKELCATIASLDPSKVTALDGQGNVLRSITLDEDEPPPPVAAPGEMTDLQLFARLISEAYAQGQRQPVLENAMAFVERQGQMLAKADAEIEKLRSHIHKLNLQIADLSGSVAPAGDDESLIGSIVAGAFAAGSGGNLASLVGNQPPKQAKK